MRTPRQVLDAWRCWRGKKLAARSKEYWETCRPCTAPLGRAVRARGRQRHSRRRRKSRASCLALPVAKRAADATNGPLGNGRFFSSLAFCALLRVVGFDFDPSAHIFPAPCSPRSREI